MLSPKNLIRAQNQQKTRGYRPTQSTHSEYYKLENVILIVQNGLKTFVFCSKLTGKIALHVNTVFSKWRKHLDREMFIFSTKPFYAVLHLCDKLIEPQGGQSQLLLLDFMRAYWYNKE